MAEQAADTKKKDKLAALKAAFELAAQTKLVTPEDNDKKVKAALKEAKQLLRELRGEPEVVTENELEEVFVPSRGDIAISKDNNANITPDQQRQIDLATEQFRQSVERVDNQILQQYVQAVQNGSYAEAEAILDNAVESQQTTNLTYALLTIAVILLPIYGQQRMRNLAIIFGLTAVYVHHKNAEKAIREQAERGAESHVRTIARDIKNNLDDAIDQELTNPAIEAQIKDKYEALAGKDGNEFRKAVKDDEEIYKYARDLILAGESRQTIIKKLQENFTNVSKRRANVIAGNEANRVFTMSQYEADEQFLAQNELTAKAYKRLVSNTGHPEAICEAIIRKTAVKPIPFHQDFIPFNKTFTTKGDNGKTYKFKPTYEHLKSGHIHVNCHCRYELLIKQDDGSFLNTFTGKVMNEAEFDESKHLRDDKGRFAKKGGKKFSVDLTQFNNRKEFHNFIEEHYFEGDFGHYDEDITDAVRAYQGMHYDKINHQLRVADLDKDVTLYGRKTTYKETVDNINEAANLALETETTLYRGTDIPFHRTIDVGESIHSRSYLSTTVLKEVSDEFKQKDYEGDNSGGSTLVITAKAGQRVILPDLVTYGKRGHTMGEAEVLIPTDSVMTVTKVEGDKVYVELN